jgi:hypothetical protein
MASKQFAVFFELDAPPPAVYLLTCQTDFSQIVAASASRAPPIKISRAASRARSFSPYVKVLKPITESPSERLDASDTSSLSDLTDLSDSRSRSSSPGSEEEPIPKPEGEAGRPSRGGYSLATELKWEAGAFKKLQVSLAAFRSWELPNVFQKCVHTLIDQHLDPTLSYQPQNESLRQTVRNAVSTFFVITAKSKHVNNLCTGNGRVPSTPALFQLLACQRFDAAAPEEHRTQSEAQD